MPMFRRAADTFLELDEARRIPIPDEPVTAAWFEAAQCRNCGAPRDTQHCGACGQKAARRFVWRDIGREAWERLRVFEKQTVKTLGRLLFAPGLVAREYVMGRRSANMHPLKLLVALVAVLALILATNGYFTHYGAAGQDAVVDRMAKRVMAYANWSFTLGIFAIFAGSWIVFRRRLGYNAIEHAVLSIYCQGVILGVMILNLLPTLIWRDPAFIVAHKVASQYYMYAIKLLIVCAGYRQFFLLNLRTDWPRLAAAGLVYAAVGWLLLRLYALAILWLVTSTT